MGEGRRPLTRLLLPLFEYACYVSGRGGDRPAGSMVGLTSLFLLALSLVVSMSAVPGCVASGNPSPVPLCSCLLASCGGPSTIIVGAEMTSGREFHAD